MRWRFGMLLVRFAQWCDRRGWLVPQGYGYDALDWARRIKLDEKRRD